MLPALILVGIVLVSTLAISASSPAGRRSRGNDAGRRARQLSRNTGEVNSGDIARMLSDAGLTVDQVARTKDGAAELGYAPFTMYAWIQKFDAHTLCEVIGERVSEHELLAHLSEGTLPQLDAIAGFAHTQAVATQPRAPREERRRLEHSPRSLRTSVVEAQSTSLPTIFEPGDWSMEEGRAAHLVGEPATGRFADDPAEGKSGREAA